MNQLEQEVTQQETQQKLKESEVKSLHNEYETLNQMLKQLESQKVEANRRLIEMDIQVRTVPRSKLIGHYTCRTRSKCS
jgi:septal ring factor EnvC (AmiA/AmiB activator)